MKSALFVSGIAMTYVTIALVVMHKWVREVELATASDRALKEAFELGMSLEQLRNGDLVDL